MDAPPSLRASRNAASRFGGGLLAVAIGWVLANTSGAPGTLVPLQILTGAVVLAAWWGGFGPGLLATVLGTIGGTYLFAPAGTFSLDSKSDALHLALFFSTGLVISLVSGAWQRALDRERKQREALMTSEERLRLAVAATQDAIWDWDIVRQTLEWSPAVTHLFGWPQVPPGTPPTWWQERIHPEDREAVLASLRAVVADPQQHYWEAEYRFFCADGSVVEVFDRGTVWRDSTGAPLRMIGAMLDQTERRKVEVEARRQREQVQAIIDTVPGLICYVDAGYVYRWNSRGYERWFGRPLDEITGRPMLEVLGAAAFAQVKGHIDRALVGEQQTEFESLLPYEGTGARWVHAIYAPHRGRDGRIDGVVVSVTDISARKQAELVSHNAAEQRRLALEGARMGTWDYRFATDELTLDRRAREIAFLPAEGTLSLERALAALTAEDRAAVKARVQEAALGEATGELRQELGFRAPDGTMHRVALYGQLVMADAPQTPGPERLVGVVLDVTEHFQAQQILLESERRWRLLSEAMPQLVWTCDASGSCDYLSAQWVRYTGIAATDHLGRKWLDALHPSDRGRAIEEWNAAVAQGTIFDTEFRIRRYDGEYRWFKTRGMAEHDGNGRVVRWLGTNTDIEDLKQAQAAAFSEAEQRRIALAAAGMGTWAWDFATGSLEWSQRTYELFGMKKGEPLHFDRFLHSVHPADRARVLERVEMATTSADGNYQAEYRVIWPDESVRWLLAQGSVQRDESGQNVRMLGVLMDVTDRMLASEQLAAARDAAESANRAKDAFLAALSHELRTPLTPVLFLAATQERAADVPPALREDFAMIRRNIELEARLIDDLLDLTRITRGKLQLDLEPTDVHAVLRRSIELLKNDIQHRQLSLRVSLAAERHEVMADAVRLQQVFWNILKNAVKFTPERGCIAVDSCVSGDSWQLAVTDSGLGITAEELPTIFDAFAQGQEASSHRFGGLGLGLAITRLLVQEHGGEIWATSDGRHQGATFFVRLALSARAELGAAAAPIIEARTASAAQRILIVEDHEPTRQTLQRLLARRGYQIVAAETAQDARAVARERRFELMISDLGLPDGSGHELAEEFSREYGLKSIALSGYGMEEDLARSKLAGFLHHITKPVDIEELHDAIVKALRE